MAKYGRLGHETGVRLALPRGQATILIASGKIVTTETRAEGVREMVESLIALTVKGKDNFETVSVTTKVPREDANGRRVREEESGRRVIVYDTVRKEIKKGKPSRVNAKHHMFAKLYAVGEFDPKHKKASEKVDLVAKLFDKYGPKYESRKGGYIRIIGISLRKGDTTMEVLLELV